jgi:hypothetical protein
MRCWLLLLLAVALAHANYYSPPISDVLANNLGLGSSLDNAYDASTASTSSMTIPFYHTPLILSGSVNIAGMSLLLDNATYPKDGLAVLVARGASGGHLQSQYSGSICSSASHASGCDFDNDGCAEYENYTSFSYVYSVTFRFRNLSSTVPYNGTIIVVPRDVLNIMKNSSGAEQLNVSISGAIQFVYQIDNPGGPGCRDNYTYFFGHVPVSANRNFTVYGTNKLYFLRAPVLREQWFRDNAFDTVILSQSPLYHADIYLNGNRMRNLTLRTFDISAGPYGIEEIKSKKSSPDGWSESDNLTTPIPLEDSPYSYAYAYEFNYGYEGIGQNLLSLIVNDSSLGSARYDESLLSRMLSYNGTTTEDGSPASSVPSRPSAAFSPDRMSSFALALGLLGLLFILSFVTGWLLH